MEGYGIESMDERNPVSEPKESSKVEYREQEKKRENSWRCGLGIGSRAPGKPS